MARKYPAEVKENAIRLMLEGKKPVAQLSRELSVTKSRLYSWSEKARKVERNTGLTLRKIHDLKLALRRAEHKNEILSFAQYANSGTRHEKLVEIESILAKSGDRYSRHLICEAFGVNRTTLLNYLYRGKRDDTWWIRHRTELAKLVQDVFVEFNSCYGAEKIAYILRSRGYRAGMHTVSEIMKQKHLYSIRQNSKRSWEVVHRPHVDLVRRRFDISEPNRTWFTDFMHVQFKNHMYSICVIVDGYARRVVGYGVGPGDTTNLLVRTFRAAYESRRPGPGLVCHSDNGSAMSSYTFGRLLANLGVLQSFSPPKDPSRQRRN